MASGGARNRSGPALDPDSARSDRRGVSLTALPSEGFTGVVPALEDYLAVVTGRHREIWVQLWSTPQACGWAAAPWMVPLVADLVAFRVRLDDEKAPVGYATAVRQLRDDVGLTSAGLKALGWSVVVDEVSAKRSEVPVRSGGSVRSRLAAVNDGG